MFEGLKIYKNQKLDRYDIARILADYGYKRVNAISEEGDFSIKGENLFIYPVTFEYPIRIEFTDEIIEGISSIDPVSYKAFSSHNMLIILPIKGLLRKKRIVSRRAKQEVSPIDWFVDIEPSDYVVHTDYGIGRYIGLERIRTAEAFNDHLVIEYKGGDKLYVPMDDLHKVQKYVAFERKPPRLYKMGSKLWIKEKEKARRGAAKVAYEILEIQAKRLSRTGFAFSKDTDWQRILEGKFPYKETKGQVESTRQVKSDMEKPHPMDRLLCGDVGYGKTEVTLRAAFKAVMDNKQVAYIVPTTILAEQHFATFTERMKEFPVNIEMLSRFRTSNEQKRIIDGLSKGTIDIVIGTHRLLSNDVYFKDLGLVIIDEEQRFGVKHKEHFKKLRLTVDVLTLTATPIPRTLYLALMGGKDISIIDTPPLERYPVKTEITKFNPSIIRKAVNAELERGGQIYFVHNRIFDIDRICEKLRKIIPDINIGIAHGRMEEGILEKTMREFIKGKVDMLLSTNIIESGIDIPNANTIFIHNADSFGLADLYQLRGRVGRFKRKAFCYLIVNDMDTLPGEAKRRLETIKQYQELGSGFKVAMEDLQIRGAGNLLGVEQHGFIEGVGFDLYCRLLRDAIESIKV